MTDSYTPPPIFVPVIGDRRHANTGAFHVLPDHVISNILSYFDYKELIHLSSVSATFYVFCNDEYVWQDIFLENTNSTFTFNGSWKHATLLKYKTTEKQLELPKQLHFEGIHSMWLYTRWYRAHIDVHDFGADKGDIERKVADQMSIGEFVEKYDALSRPVLICKGIDHWKAHNNWSRENMLKIWGETDFKVSDRGGKKFKMKMKDYLRYLDVQHDEDPLYIFDSGFGERAPDMLKDYDIPKFFPDDFFDLMGKHRPSYRWFVMGPPRSGAPWHVDPAGTSAWNALLHGRKRWLLYPPGDMPPGVIPQTSSKGETTYVSPSSLIWLLEVYPFLAEDEKPIECIQNPGEVIFVPAGWWHMVLNLTESTAVTQNYANDCNFQPVCEDFFNDRREVYYFYKRKMLEARPEYAKKFAQFEDIIDATNADFDDLDFWAPYVSKILMDNGLAPADSKPDISVLNDGTNPVFLANNMVVKFYSKRFGGERNFKAESGMYRSAQESSIADVCPKLLAQGNIEIHQTIKAKALDLHSGMMSDSAEPIPDVEHNGKDAGENGHLDNNQNGHSENEKGGEKENGKDDEVTGSVDASGAYPVASEKGKSKKVEVSGTWPYLVMSYIEGSNIITARDNELQIDMDAVAKFLAKNAVVLHTLKMDTNGVDPRESYKQFLQTRREKVMRSHWLWRSLPPALILQIEAYLPSDVSELICAEHVFTLHSDLTDENVIGVEVEAKGKKGKKGKKSKNKGEPKNSWIPKYLIDFGDSRKGDICYELVSLYISALECNKAHVRVFLENYSLPSGGTLWDYYNKNRSSMIRRLMCTTLLHECDALMTAFRHMPDAKLSNSFEELANTLWGL